VIARRPRGVAGQTPPPSRRGREVRARAAAPGDVPFVIATVTPPSRARRRACSSRRTLVSPERKPEHPVEDDGDLPLGELLRQLRASWAPRKARRILSPSAPRRRADRRLHLGLLLGAHEERNPAFEDGNEGFERGRLVVRRDARLSLGGPGRPYAAARRKTSRMVFSASSRRRSCTRTDGERRAAGRSFITATRGPWRRHFRHASSRVQPFRQTTDAAPGSAEPPGTSAAKRTPFERVTGSASESKLAAASGASRVDLARLRDVEGGPDGGDLHEPETSPG